MTDGNLKAEVNPLVSIVVITYNSSKFIIETLESAKAQSYPCIELIISDDCSSDDTVSLCNNWIEANKGRFVRTELITAPQNTGIAPNCNRGLNAAKGDWIKYCAGDDFLMPDCVNDNLDYIDQHPGCRILFSYANVYQETFDEINLIKKIPGSAPTNIINEKITALSQYNLLLLSDRITFTPSSFIYRKTQLQVGGFNEKIKLQEDYPMWLSLTKAGYKLHFMEKETVKYRRHVKATNNMVTDYLIKPNYFKTENFRREYIYPNLPWDIRMNQQFAWYGSQLFRNNWLNRNKKLNRVLLTATTIWLNPFKYLIYFKKLLFKDLKNKEFYL